MFTSIASNPWAYPALEVVHIVGIALLLGNLVLLESRVRGAAATLPLPALARVALPLVLAGFGLCAASGLLMFASQPLDLLGFTFNGEKGDAVLRVEYLWLAGKTYGQRSSPA